MASHGDLSQGLAGLSHCAPVPHKGTMGCRLLGLGSAGQSGKNVGSEVFQAQCGAARQWPSKASKLPPIAGVAFMSGARLEEGPSHWWAAGTASGNGSLVSILGSCSPLRGSLKPQQLSGGYRSRAEGEWA